MAKRARKSYTPQQRAAVLAAAQRENLTANQVKQRFGVTPVTYYSWRKKEGITGPRGRRPKAALAAGGNLSSQVRAGVQAKVRAILPGIVREEVAGYLDSLFGSGGGRRGRRRRRGRPRGKK
ncbi:MAG TPA: transposase [Candidatus Eisenbacteria bacterium]|nr:transposase [Candidatus Eisenbacteria bacterium]